MLAYYILVRLLCNGCTLCWRYGILDSYQGNRFAWAPIPQVGYPTEECQEGTVGLYICVCLCLLSRDTC